jgi:hypothetical protein
LKDFITGNLLLQNPTGEIKIVRIQENKLAKMLLRHFSKRNEFHNGGAIVTKDVYDALTDHIQDMVASPTCGTWKTCITTSSQFIKE